MKFETERLIIRPYKLSDVDNLVIGLNNLNVTKYLVKDPYPYTKKDAKKYVLSEIKEKKRKKPNNYAFALILKSNNKLIGGVGADIKYQHITATTRSWINEDYWEKGLITEAKIVFHDFLFNKLKLRKLRSGVYSNNVHAQKSLLKLGFKKEGFQRKQIICNATGKIHDVIQFGLLKEDWIKARRKLLK